MVRVEIPNRVMTTIGTSVSILCSDSRDFYSKLYPHPRLAGTCNYNASEDTRDSTVSAADGGDVWRVIAG